LTTRRIGPFTVPAIGLGCMNLSHAYGTPPEPAAAEALLLQALDAGVTLFDTAALYGFGANESLVGRVLKPHRQRIVLAGDPPSPLNPPSGCPFHPRCSFATDTCKSTVPALAPFDGREVSCLRIAEI
jgi:oligopeptide/dipeptide ABC transporter ATP-binding protein